MKLSALTVAVVGFAAAAHAASHLQKNTRWVAAANVPKKRGTSRHPATKKKTKAPPPPDSEDEYDEEEEDEDFEDEYSDEEDYRSRRKAVKGRSSPSRRPPPPPPRQKKGRSSRGSSSRRHSGSMVAYDYRRGAPVGPSLTERLMAQSKALAGASFAASQAAASAATKAGKEAAANAQRAAKAKTSSEFEKLLMRATAPLDTPVMGPDMSLLFAEIRGFPRKAKRRGAPNPYEKTLHKLWTKMLEPDWRTTVKGVGVLHRVSRDAKAQDRAAFAEHAARLKKARRPKSDKKKNQVLKYRYFDRRALAASMSPAGGAYGPFATAYFDFVVLRLSSTTGRMAELNALASSGSPASSSAAAAAEDTSEACATLSLGNDEAAAATVAAAQELLAAALRVEPVQSASKLAVAAAAAAPAPASKKKGSSSSSARGGKKGAARASAAAAMVAVPPAEPNIVVCDCQYLVADDLEAIWKGISAVLKVAMQQAAQGAASAEDLAAARSLAAWWLDHVGQVANWRQAYKKSMGAIKFKVSPPDPEKWLAIAAVESFLAAPVTAPPPAAAAAGTSVESEQEDYEDEEEETEEAATPAAAAVESPSSEAPAPAAKAGAPPPAVDEPSETAGDDEDEDFEEEEEDDLEDGADEDVDDDDEEEDDEEDDEDF